MYAGDSLRVAELHVASDCRCQLDLLLLRLRQPRQEVPGRPPIGRRLPGLAVHPCMVAIEEPRPEAGVQLREGQHRPDISPSHRGAAGQVTRLRAAISRCSCPR